MVIKDHRKQIISYLIFSIGAWALVIEISIILGTVIVYVGEPYHMTRSHPMI